MSYSPEAHRAAERERCLRLVHDGGPGWDEYVRHEARRLAKEDPSLHAQLPAEIEEAIRARSAHHTTT
jgi:hypothetical protein